MECAVTNHRTHQFIIQQTFHFTEYLVDLLDFVAVVLIRLQDPLCSLRETQGGIQTTRNNLSVEGTEGVAPNLELLGVHSIVAAEQRFSHLAHVPSGHASMAARHLPSRCYTCRTFGTRCRCTTPRSEFSVRRTRSMFQSSGRVMVRAHHHVVVAFLNATSSTSKIFRACSVGRRSGARNDIVIK